MVDNIQLELAIQFNDFNFYNPMRTRQLVAILLAFSFVVPLFAQEKTLKRKVAIGRFSNETQYAKGVFYNKDNDPMRKQALDLLSAKLAASGKFILLEREDLDLLVSELGKDMQKIPADYIILGSITEFGRKTEGNQRVFSSTKTQIVEAGVSLRLVDVQTGMIIYSDEARGMAETTSKQTMGLGGTAGFDATLSDKAISAALNQLVENVINKCMDRPWRGYILSEEEGSLIISGGTAQGLNPGDVLKVYERGKQVKNPQSGMMVELPGKQIGTVTIEMSIGELPENEISFCAYEGSLIDMDNVVNYYISDK